MPALPELHDGLGDIGVVEVLHKLKADHPPQAHGHVAVAGEVEVNLEGIGRQAQPGPHHGQFLPGHGEEGVPHAADGVGQEHLLGKAHGKPLHAGDEFPQALLPVHQLLSHGLVLDDGAGDQLGEQGDEGAEGDDVLLHRRILAVDVNGIGHGLEGVERDADRQRDAEEGQAPAGDGVDAAHKEIPVLEKEQNGQIEKHR